MKLLEHVMKVVERVLKKKIRCLANMNKMQFGFMPGKGTIDALFILRRMQEEYQDKGKRLYMCFVELEKAFDRVPAKVMKWAMRKTKVPEVMVEAVMSLYDEAKSRWDQVYLINSQKCWCTSKITASPLLFAIVIDAVTERVRDGSINEILYADDLVLVTETMKDLRDDF